MTPPITPPRIKFPIKSIGVSWTRPLLAREAQVEDDQGDTDQELKDRHFETMNIEHESSLFACGDAVWRGVINSSDPRL